MFVSLNRMGQEMNNFRHIACLMLVSALLTACGGGGGSSASAAPDQIVIPAAVDNPSSDPGVPGVVDTPGKTAHATVTWSAPTVREDGRAFTQEEIAHYEVYHIEEASGDMDIIQVKADATEYNVALASGTHELGVAVVDVNGVKSQMSDLQTVEIN
jgi:ABC-type glycerol-3-phosphate transport system substrate-binding protein